MAEPGQRLYEATEKLYGLTPKPWTAMHPEDRQWFVDLARLARQHAAEDIRGTTPPDHYESCLVMRERYADLIDPDVEEEDS